jgi:hypothetical protein
MSGYRPVAYAAIARGRSVTQIAQDVHSAVIGASEMYEGIDRDVEALQMVADTWHSGSKLTDEFDRLVLALVAVALTEYKRRSPQQPQPALKPDDLLDTLRLIGSHKTT